MSSPTPKLLIEKRHEKRLFEVHRQRTLDTLDSRARLNFQEGYPPTACWSFRDGGHVIHMNKTLPTLIRNPEILKKPRRGRKELNYLKNVYLHEVAHGMYTSRDFKGMNEKARNGKIPFDLLNLFEDARIEALFRGRRPTSKTGSRELNYKGLLEESKSYGVRKFDWMIWDTYNLDTPESVFLSFIKAEGTKDNLKILESTWVDQYGGLGVGFESIDKRVEFPNFYVPPKTPLGYHTFLKMWRDIAGRNMHKRYPTTESLFPFCKAWLELFPGSKRDIDQIAGTAKDLIEAAVKEGIEPYRDPEASEKPPEKPEEDSRASLKSIDFDDRERGKKACGKSGKDESDIETKKIELTLDELKSRGLTAQYFDYV